MARTTFWRLMGNPVGASVSLPTLSFSSDYSWSCPGRPAWHLTNRLWSRGPGAEPLSFPSSALSPTPSFCFPWATRYYWLWLAPFSLSWSWPSQQVSVGTSITEAWLIILVLPPRSSASPYPSAVLLAQQRRNSTLKLNTKLLAYSTSQHRGSDQSGLSG